MQSSRAISPGRTTITASAQPRLQWHDSSPTNMPTVKKPFCRSVCARGSIHSSCETEVLPMSRPTTIWPFGRLAGNWLILILFNSFILFMLPKYARCRTLHGKQPSYLSCLFHPPQNRQNMAIMPESQASARPASNPKASKWPKSSASAWPFSNLCPEKQQKSRRKFQSMRIIKQAGET